MNKPCIYEIKVRGTLTERWSTWFEDLEIHPGPNGETVLTGQLLDQAAVFGVLSRIHSLNLELLSLWQLPPA